MENFQYVCQFCNKKFVTETGFNIHNRQHSEEEIKDTVDPIDFQKEFSSFKSGNIVQDQLETYQCELCGIIFYSPEDIYNHFRIVHEQFPFNITLLSQCQNLNESVLKKESNLKSTMSNEIGL